MKKLNLRIIHTHDTEARWLMVPDFVPRAGELIVYDIDDAHAFERVKIGDGVTKLIDLPFTVESAVANFLGISDNILIADGGRID